MIPTGAREYSVELNDFPITLAVLPVGARAANVVPKIHVTYIDRATNSRTVIEVDGVVAQRVLRFQISRPDGFTSGVILFSLLAAFPNTQTVPYEVRFVSNDNQQVADQIYRFGNIPVFANYAMDLKS